MYDLGNITLTYPQAKRIKSLIEEYQEFSKLTVGDVLDLNSVIIQLDMMIQEHEREAANELKR